MMGDLADNGGAVPVCSRAAGKHFSNTPVQEPAPGKTSLFIHQSASFLVVEVVDQRSISRRAPHLRNQSLADQLLEGCHGFFLAAPAGLAQCVKIEGSTDDGSSCEQLPAGFAYRDQARL